MALFRPPRDADNAFCASEPGNLGRDTPGGSSCAGDQYRIAFSNLSDVRHSEVGRQPCSAECAEHDLWRDAVRNRCEAAHGARFSVRQGVFLPAQHARNEIAHGIARMPRFDDLADGGGPHHLSNSHWRDVALYVIQPAPHRGFESEVEVSNKNLIVTERGKRLLHALEVTGPHHAHRSGPEAPLSIRMLVGLIHSPDIVGTEVLRK